LCSSLDTHPKNADSVVILEPIVESRRSFFLVDEP
jgi:hypothetical protein